MRFMRADELQWQRVDNTGALQRGLMIFFLSWAALVPYVLVNRDDGWLAWSAGCVVAGIAMLVRERRRRRAHRLPGVSVEVIPTQMRAGELMVVRLALSGEIARTVRWWKASVVGRVDEKFDEYAEVSHAEFAVDPPAEGEPVNEMELALAAPTASTIDGEPVEEWFVQVTVETKRGRMEMGRVAVKVVPTSG